MEGMPTHEAHAQRRLGFVHCRVRVVVASNVYLCIPWQHINAVKMNLILEVSNVDA